jgi:lipid kinase YegS
MSEKICLILHRKSANRPEIKDAVKAARKAGADLRVLVPFNKREKPRVVREALARGAERIVAGGGDGTINAVANALIGDGSEKPAAELGIMPLGTANDFARGCGLPVDDLAACLQIACTRASRPIDVGKVNDRFFINVASAGFGAEITATTPVKLKRALGGGAYALMGLVKAAGLSPYPVRLRVKGEEPATGQMLFMAVGNNRFAGGGFEVAAHSKMDDGLLDLTAVLQGSGLDLARLKGEMEDPFNRDNQNIFYRRFEKFTIESDNKLHCNLDGEPYLRKKLRFSVLPGHLKVVF